MGCRQEISIDWSIDQSINQSQRWDGNDGKLILPDPSNLSQPVVLVAREIQVTLLGHNVKDLRRASAMRSPMPFQMTDTLKNPWGIKPHRSTERKVTTHIPVDVA